MFDLQYFLLILYNYYLKTTVIQCKIIHSIRKYEHKLQWHLKQNITERLHFSQSLSKKSLENTTTNDLSNFLTTKSLTFILPNKTSKEKKLFTTDIFSDSAMIQMSCHP